MYAKCTWNALLYVKRTHVERYYCTWNALMYVNCRALLMYAFHEYTLYVKRTHVERYSCTWIVEWYSCTLYMSAFHVHAYHVHEYTLQPFPFPFPFMETGDHYWSSYWFSNKHHYLSGNGRAVSRRSRYSYVKRKQLPLRYCYVKR